MKSLFSVAAILAIVCSTPEAGRQELLMDEVEMAIRLPKGAKPLDAYGRYYGLDEQGRIVGLYTIPHDPLPADVGCAEVLTTPKLTLRDVPCDPFTDPHDLPAGQRRWVGDSDELPFIADGGCGVIRVVYDPATRTVEHAFCHGN